ncbi:leucine-rich repeat-containing protein 15-like [Contarinia nasturtii]|uniref:leucine-rich repeat-containing protein 15-like n=1 Tax=Contarinia nasturtii TaxID=265458 RepID=UPI0012D4C398|nr:leucine-rich repeat-containing protein 15-like [Contarinia nasturtii]
MARTMHSIFVYFLFVKLILVVSCDQLLLPSSSEAVECSSHYYDSDRVGKLAFICSNSSRINDYHHDQNLGYLRCTNKSGNVYKTRIYKIQFENCEMSKLVVKYDIFQQFTQLQELNISYIGLETLEKDMFTKAGYLKKLNASHNNIEDIPALLFLNADNLQEVDFSYNKIKRMDSFALSGAKKLTSVYFSYNHITNLNGLVFGNVFMLENLNLSNNEINEVEPKTFAALKHLTTLDLSFNNVRKLNKSAFDGLDNLKILRLVHLSNSTIEIFPSAFVGLDKLSQLYLSHNHIASINKGVFEGLHNLKNLFLYQTFINELTEFAFSGIDQITELDLSCNQLFITNNQSRTTFLNKETFNNLVNLTKLNLANNPIETLNIGIFAKLQHLSHLNLSNTNLKEVKLGTFSHTRNLQLLDLSWNQLKTFDFAQFLPKYSSLHSLYLNENQLTELEGFTQMLLPSLKLLGISGNKFNCSYLKDFMRKIMLQNITFINDWTTADPHQTNIHGIKCEDEIDSSDIYASTTTSTIIKYEKYDDLKLIQEHFSTSLTEAFSVFSRQNDLHSIQYLLILLCILLSMLILIVLIINRNKILNIRRYRFPYPDGQSRACINSDFEVSTFNQDLPR